MIHQEQWQQLVAMIARHAQQDGRTASAIDFLSLAAARTPPAGAHCQLGGVCADGPGQKALRMGDDVMHYGPGDLLLVTMDMPVQSCVVLATPEKPCLGVGITINEARLLRYLEHFPPQQIGSAAPNAALPSIKSRHRWWMR